jgi:hypothetical protein
MGDEMPNLKEYEIRGAEGCERVVQERANVLLIGDRVNLFADQPGAPYGWGTVVEVTENEAIVVRPYVHTADFETTSGLMSYLGQEIVKLDRRSDRVLTVVFRTTIPR